MGGQKKYVEKLQKVFDEGLYDPANEPDIAYPYLFSRFRGEEWRTQKLVPQLLSAYFTTRPDGIPGNDDTGTMSAWAVFSMMGFYPDCPGEPYYTLTTPTFDRVTITLDPTLCGGQSELVLTKTCSGESGSYERIKEIRLGGRRPSSYRVSHSDFVQAGTVNYNCIKSK